MVVLFNEVTFKSFTRNELTDTKTSTEVLFSIGAASKEDVNRIAKKAAAAGGTVFSEPSGSQGWMCMVAHFLIRMDIVGIRYTWT